MQRQAKRLRAETEATAFSTIAPGFEKNPDIRGDRLDACQWETRVEAPFSFLHRARRCLSFRASTEKKDRGAESAAAAGGRKRRPLRSAAAPLAVRREAGPGMAFAARRKQHAACRLHPRPKKRPFPRQKHGGFVNLTNPPRRFFYRFTFSPAAGPWRCAAAGPASGPVRRAPARRPSAARARCARSRRIPRRPR